MILSNIPVSVSKVVAPRSSTWTPEDKFTAVLEAASLSGAELETLLRRRGLRREHIEQWRRQMLAALRGPHGHQTSRGEKRAAPVARAANPRTRSAAEAEPASFVARLRGVIDEHLADDRFRVGALARHLAMSRSLLYRRLMELDQPPPAKLILDRRLRRAAELLANAEGSVGDVAYAVGFGSASSFTQCFRKRFGLVPSAYRKGHGGSANLLGRLGSR